MVKFVCPLLATRSLQRADPTWAPSGVRAARAAGARCAGAWRELVMLTEDDGASCLLISAEEGHLKVVKALLEVGGRKLLLLTADDGGSCLSVAPEAKRGEVFRVLEMAYQNAGWCYSLSSHEITILKRG